MLVASPQNFPAPSGDPNAGGLTNLDVNTISNCLFGVAGDAASVGPGGTKFVTYTNSQANQIYYVGVQCQDQTAAQFAFVPVFSAQPFSSLDQNGNEYLNAFNVPYYIPDGNNAHPGVSYVMALAVQPMEMRRVTVTNTITHQNFGDLLGALGHGGQGVVLNDHDGYGNVSNLALIYDDSGAGDIVGSQPSDGPGSLNNFTTQEAAGLWMLNEADDSPGNTGEVNNLQIRIEPHKAGNGIFLTVTVPPMGWYYDYINVGVGYTNLLVVATNLAPTAVPFPIQLYVQPGSEPTLASTNDEVLLTNCVVGTYPTGVDPGNEISTGPPLNPGIYYIGLYNPTTQPVTVLYGTFLYFNSAAVSTSEYQSQDTPIPLLDDAVTDSSIFVTNTQTIQDLIVGVRVDHPRISDLVFTLIDPDGARYLLMENRGGQSTNGCGITVISTNQFSATADGGSQPNTNVINTGVTSGVIPITYNFYTAVDEMSIYYGPNVAATNLIYDTGVTNNPSGPVTILVPYGPTNTFESTYVTIVMDQFLSTNRSDAWTYTAGSAQTNYYYLSFTSDTNLTTTPIKYAPVPFLPVFPTNTTFTDSFEAYNQGVYNTNSGPTAATNGFGGWTVLTNQVEIISNLPAFNGTNYLQLDNGAVRYLLPTLAGQQYLLTYAEGNKAPQEDGSPATNAAWVVNTLTFTASSNGTPLVLDASGLGLAVAAGSIITTPFDTNALFDAFTLKQLPQNLYYQPEQTLTPLNGTSANGTNGSGTWTLEILDNRAGATNPAPVLDSWDLNFTFANTNFTIPTSTIIPGQTVTNFAPPNSLTWYEINVPSNAVISTNSLLFASLPLNVWFSTNVPPTITNALTGDTEFLADSLGGSFLIATNTPSSATNLVGGETYYLGVQNTNQFSSQYALDVTFDLVNVTNAFAPPFATTLPATAVTGTNAQLNGFATANGTNATAWFQWGPTTSYPYTTPATAIGNATNTVTYFTAAITNLTFAQIYHARLVVTNALGTAFGADVQFAPGTPVSWGLDTSLQTNVPAGLSNIVAVAGGLNHSLALSTNGTVIGWGDNGANQITIPSFPTNVVSIAAGGNDSLALLANGTVVEWGDNTFGQRAVPAFVTNAVAIAAGWSNSIALLNNGTVVTWGDGSLGQTNIPSGLILSSNIVSVAAGGNDILALLNNGTVMAWGNTASQTNVPALLTNIVALAEGDGAPSLALSNNNQVVAWGASANGSTTVPPGLTTNVVAIAAGQDDGIALLNNDTVTAWGNDVSGQTNVPVGLTAFAIAAGANHVLALTPEPPVFPPYANTLPASGVTGTNAQLNGFATANGQVSAAWFQWGLSTSYGFTTPAVAIGNASTVTYCTAALTNLLFAQIYHAQLVVSNAVGIAYGADVQFAPGMPVAWGADTLGQTTIPAGLSNIVAVAGGLNHSLALSTNGTVIGWGDNNASQLNIPPFPTNVVSIAAGGDDSLALLADGTVREWGDNGAGQTIVPANAINVVAIAAGWSNSVALLSNGTLVVWGDNTYGETNIPASLINSSNVVGVAAGGNDVMALLNNGTVVSWGNNTGQTNVPGTLVNVVAVAEGSFHSLALLNNGTVSGWGDTNYGETIAPAGLADVVAIAAGFDDSIALQNNGTVTAWGNDVSGQTNVPAGLTAFAIAAGEDHVLALAPQPPQYPPFANTEPASGVTGTNAQLNGFATANGFVSTAWFRWGTSTNYPNQTAPVAVGTGYNVVYVTNAINNLIFGEAYHFQIVVSNSIGITYGYDQLLVAGSTIGWGDNSDAQITPPAGISNVVAIAAGGNHSLEITNGAVLAWGDNVNGESTVPANLSSNVIAIAGGATHSLAVQATNGLVSAWGDSTYGETTVPNNLSNIVAVAGGGNTSMALGSNGLVTAWGYNTNGLTNVPAGLSNVVQIAVGGEHALALLNNGTVVGWGTNTAGQLSVPFGLANVVAVSAGAFHSLALLNNGTVKAWGDDSYGETNVPADLTNVEAIAAGGYHNLALLNNGNVVAWGRNDFLQTNVPVTVSNATAVAAGEFHSLALTSPYNINLNLTNYIINPTNPTPDTNVVGPGGLLWFQINVPTNAVAATNTLVFATGPVNLWWSTNQPPSTNTPVDVELLTNQTTGTVVLYTNPVPPFITPGGVYYLGVQNPGTLSVTDAVLVTFELVQPNIVLTNGVPSTNTVGANSILWQEVQVPFDALAATNALIFATTNVNLWFSTNVPPTTTNAAAGDFELQTNSFGGTNVISPATIPTLVPGGVYYLGVENTNDVPATYALEVTFEFPDVSISSILQTNIGGTNGYLLTWYAPTNYQFHLQWTTNLLPAVVWTEMKGVISFDSYVSATNSHFSFFDTGDTNWNSAPLGPMRFYRLHLLNSPTNTAPEFYGTPADATVAPLILFTVTNAARDFDLPAQNLTYALYPTNALINANGVITWTPPATNTETTNLFTTVVFDNGVPVKYATNQFTVYVLPSPSGTVAVHAAIVTNGVSLTWMAPTNDQFQVDWTTNIAPPVVWTPFPPPPVTSTNGVFNFIDTNAPFPMKFYELILL